MKATAAPHAHEAPPGPAGQVPEVSYAIPAASAERGRSMDPKQFYRRMEAIFDGLENGASSEALATTLVPRVLDKLGAPLGIRGAHVYRRAGAGLSLVGEWGADATDLSRELARRLEGDSSEAIAELPWAGRTQAGITGLLSLEEDRGILMVLFFHGRIEVDLGGGWALGQLLFALSSFHYALSQHLKRKDLEDTLDRARSIQLSLLPGPRPRFADYDIAAACVPAHSVGGDLYDFLHLDPDALAFAVADAAGHGFPAALQARDVATGLRMGVERDLRITRTVEKLNRVIHRSGLVSRFVSLFFGELEKNGNLTYVNAGHPPPILLNDSGLHPLTVGGMILGPQPDASYKLGFTHLDRGSALAVFSDGVIERSQEDREFGVEGVKSWLLEWRDGPADRALADLLSRLTRFGDRAEFQDDVTAMYIRRPR